MNSSGLGLGVLILSQKRLGAAVSFLAGLAGAAIVLFGDQAGARLWVWDYLRWVSWPVRFGLALAIVVVSLPAVQGLLSRAWEHRPTRLPAWPLIPLCGVIFWLAREKTYRGDALLKLQLFSTKTLQTDPYVWKEPLDALAGYTLTNWLRPLGLKPDMAIAVLSVVAGMIYVAAVLEGSRHLGLGPTRRMLLMVGLLALGTSQLWFGHVENYSLVTAFSMVATALALGYLTGKRPLWGAGLAAGAAVAAHPQASSWPRGGFRADRFRRWLVAGESASAPGAGVQRLRVGADVRLPPGADRALLSVACCSLRSPSACWPRQRRGASRWPPACLPRPRSATMPRVFFHAHLGVLDFADAATWFLATLTFYYAASSRRWWAPLLAGLGLGLALLTKINAVLLVPYWGSCCCSITG